MKTKHLHHYVGNHQNRSKFLVLALGCMILPGVSTAALVAYEGFDYAAGALGSASGGTGWTSNWSSNSATLVTATALSFGSLDTTGGSIGGLAGGINRFGASRTVDLATPGLLANGTELWFSVMMGYDTGGNRTNSRLALALGNGSFNTTNFNYNINGGGTGSALGVTLGNFSSANGKIVATQFTDGATGNGGGFGSNVFGTAQTIQIVPSATNTQVDYAYVVGRITWGATSLDNDTIDIFLPGTDFALPGTPHSTLSVLVDQSGYDTVSFARGDRVVMDEIRFGSSYADVSPIPEPSAALLGGLGLLSLLRRRR